MNAEIIAVGTELLLGDTINTNASYIAKRFAEMGISIYRQSVVGDNQQRLLAVLQEAISRSDLVITTGGLGPTDDDLTKETVAKLFDLPMKTDPQSLEILKSIFANANWDMPKSNLKQAEFPEGAIIFQNPKGTAPGCAVVKNNKTVMVLPGPPREMTAMFESAVVPYLESKLEYTIRSRALRVVGVGESRMEELVKDIMNSSENPTLAPYAKEGECELRISARAGDEKSAFELIKPIEAAVRNILGTNIYGADSDKLESVVAQILRDRNKTFSLAESCTGGMLSSRYASVAGISDVYAGGVVSYSNDVKEKFLGVKKSTIEKYGAVSEQCVSEMAEGIRKATGTDYALAVSGVAGPSGGTEEKPVGFVCFALGHEGGVITTTNKFIGERDIIRLRASVFASNMLRLHLLGVE